MRYGGRRILRARDLILQLPLRTYSTGMWLRLSFAIAMAARPEILVLDEMIGTGDAAFTAKAHVVSSRTWSTSSTSSFSQRTIFTWRAACAPAVWSWSGARFVADAPIVEAIEAYHNDEWRPRPA